MLLCSHEGKAPECYVECYELTAPILTQPENRTLFEDNVQWAAAIAQNVWRSLPPSFDVADLTQVAYIEMWKRAQIYRSDNERGTPFRSYAYQYVRGAVLMSVRRRAWKDATGEPISPVEIDTKPLPDEQAAAKQRRKNVTGPQHYRQITWLRGAIDKLKPIDAYLVWSVHIVEQDMAQVAERIGMEPRAVSRRLAGIVKRLRRLRALDGSRKRKVNA